jgi:type IV pilus assembly protein PilQ
MKSAMKSRGMRFLVLLGFIMLAWTAVEAENDSEREEKKEILTALEQRMQKRIDKLEFREEEIDNVITMIARYADIDIIKSPDVTGMITATLTDVPVGEALNNILAAHDFGYIKSEHMIRIVPIKEITEIPERLVNRIYWITYADVEEVAKTLTGFLSDRGALSSSPSTSNIIVTDTESRIEAIDTFISEIDRVTPQILVEARIYDITSKDRLDLGVDWEAGRNTIYDATDGLSGVGTNPTTRRDPFMTGKFSGATGKTSGTTGILRLGWLNDGIDIDTMLKAQQNKIDAKLLANPRVLVLDNEIAIIKIITEKPYIELTETSAGGSIGTTKFREIGVELQVKPHLTRDRMIRLELLPKFSVETGTVSVVQIGTDQEYPQPIVDKREAQTTLLIKHAQTVVLGGLRKKDVAKQVNKIPLLGDIPLLGGLFRFEGEDTVTSELVVFVTPWIVETPVMTEVERKAYKETEFSGPEPAFTKAEKAVEKAKKKAKK